MQAKDAIKQSIGVADMITNKYLDDLDEPAFFARPVAGMNHIAWQIGHLITSERGMVEAVKPGSCPPLPEGFDDKHRKPMATSDDQKAFYTKAEYLDFWKAQRAATLEALDSLDDADLDTPAPEKLRHMCPTVGHVFNLTGLHPLMHVGQYVAVRRLEGKPIVF